MTNAKAASSSCSPIFNRYIWKQLKDMMKRVFLILVIGICSSFTNQADDCLFWPDQKLAFDDFKGTPDTKSSKPAKSEFMIDVTDMHLENNIPKYDVKCFFRKHQSWIVVCDKQTIAREQLRFDLHEVYARKTRKAFDSLNKAAISEGSKYQSVLTAYIEKNNAANVVFDREIGADPKNEKIWSKKISGELSLLAAYAIPPK